jgi:aspartate aminotransferase
LAPPDIDRLVGIDCGPTVPKQRLAPKVDAFPPSLTLALKALVAERRAAHLPVHDFGLGETRGALPEPIAEAAIRAYKEGLTVYGDPAGLPALREAVLSWLALEGDYGIDSVVVTTGAKQGLLNVFLALMSPGDVVLLDSAPWVSYQPLAITASAESVCVRPESGTGNWLKVESADLEREIRRHPRARIFLVNSPCNPTGQLYSARELNALLRTCAENEVFFVLDRLYWRLTYDGADFPEPEVDEVTRPWLIQVDGLSKNWRRTGGLRIGWTVAPEDVTRGMINLQSHYTSGPTMPAQYAALAALTEPYDPEMRQELEDKRDLMLDHGARIPHVELWPIPAAFYSFWDLRGTFGLRTPEGSEIASSDDFARYLLDSAGVVTCSGSGFEQDGFLRVTFTAPDDELIEGLAAAAEAVSILR